jgi:short-subunit dehydrogenase
MSMQESFSGKVVLITGASSGIGEELALQLAQRGALLTLAARRAALLEEMSQKIGATATVRPLVVECDVTKDGDVEHAVAETVRERGKLDIVFANAGFGVAGMFTKLTLEVLRTLYAALPEVKKTKGQLVITGSVAGWAATPGTSAYAMSKFALRALANSITPELAVAGVKVTLISPGYFESELRRVDNRGKLHPEVPEPIPAWLLVPRATAAREILRAVARGRREAIITGHGKLLVAVERFAPWILRAAGRRMAGRGRGYRPEPKSG